MPHIFNTFKILSQIPLKQNDVLDLGNCILSFFKRKTPYGNL